MAWLKGQVVDDRVLISRKVSFQEEVKAEHTGCGFGILNVARAKYSFAVNGGAISTITPAAAFNAVLPDNAVIIGGTVNCLAACTSSGAATVSVGTSAGSSTTAILGATAVASLTLDACINAVPVFATPVKLTAAGSITFSIAAFALTAGIIEVTLLYFVASA